MTNTETTTNTEVIAKLVELLREAEYVRDFNDKAGNWPMVHRAKGKCVAYIQALRLLGWTER